MKRNFANESFLNYIFRGVKATIGRLRGRVLSGCKVFAPGTSLDIYFGRYPRFMNSKGIRLGNKAKFGLYARIECHADDVLENPIIVVDDNSSFGDYVHIGAVCGVFVGKYVLAGSNILIIDHSHGKPSYDMEINTKESPRHRQLTSKGPIVIGDNVWIGDNCVILSGVTIGEGCILPAGSVVKRNVQPYTIYSAA